MRVGGLGGERGGFGATLRLARHKHSLSFIAVWIRSYLGSCEPAESECLRKSLRSESCQAAKRHLLCMLILSIKFTHWLLWSHLSFNVIVGLWYDQNKDFLLLLKSNGNYCEWNMRFWTPVIISTFHFSSSSWHKNKILELKLFCVVIHDLQKQTECFSKR